MNPADGVVNGIRIHVARNEDSHRRRDQNRHEIEIAGTTVKRRVATADATGELDWSSEERDCSRDSVNVNPIASGSKVNPRGIGSVMQEEAFVVVEHEERADCDGEIEKILGRSEACSSLHERTSGAWNGDSTQWPGSD